MVRNREHCREPNRFLGFRAVAEAVLPIVHPIISKRGLGAELVLQRWPEIVGPHLSGQIWPERLVFPRGRRQDGVLHLRVNSGAAAIEIQHLQPLIIERINGVFGFRAIARLRLTHGSLPTSSASDKPQEPSAWPPASPPVMARDAEESLVSQLNGIEDEALQAALRNLGRAVLSRPSAPSENT